MDYSVYGFKIRIQGFKDDGLLGIRIFWLPDDSHMTLIGVEVTWRGTKSLYQTSGSPEYRGPLGP